MKQLKTENPWKFFFEDRGVSSEIAKSYTDYIDKLVAQDLPVIFEIEHLSQLFGIKTEEVVKMIYSTNYFYRKFKIRKRSGGERLIQSPYPSLLSCQRWIYKNILLKQRVHDSANGFVPTKSIASNALPHLGQKALLKMDLKNFFPSIPINWVVNFFSSLGYANNVSFYLAALCCLDGALTQGSVTSPYLSNILLKNLDHRLHKIALSYQLNYTRYADDLTFSGNYIPHDFIQIISDIVSSYRLEVNEIKTRLHTKPGQRIVTGISVSGEHISIPRAKKREIRKELHFIQKYGYLSHIAKRRIKDPFYLDVIQGKLAFWLQIEPKDNFAISALQYIKELKLQHK